jgi:hypothetical protein
MSCVEPDQKPSSIHQVIRSSSSPSPSLKGCNVLYILVALSASSRRSRRSRRLPLILLDQPPKSSEHDSLSAVLRDPLRSLLVSLPLGSPTSSQITLAIVRLALPVEAPLSQIPDHPVGVGLFRTRKRGSRLDHGLFRPPQLDLGGGYHRLTDRDGHRVSLRSLRIRAWNLRLLRLVVLGLVLGLLVLLMLDVICTLSVSLPLSLPLSLSVSLSVGLVRFRYNDARPSVSDRGDHPASTSSSGPVGVRVNDHSRGEVHW